MPTPVERIRAGIDEIDGINRADRLLKLGTRHRTPVQFQTLLISVLKDTGALRAMDKHVSEKRAARKADILKSWDRKGWEEGKGGRIDRMGATARKQFSDADIRDMEKEILSDVPKEREETVARLMDARTHLTAGYIVFADPVSLLTRKTAGQAAKVLEHFAMLASAGPMHLEAYSVMAAQNDSGPEREAMAMAVNMRIDQLDRKSRQSLTFSRADNAMMAVGVEWKRIAGVLAITDYVVSQGLLHDKALRGKKVDGQDKINIGFALGKAEKEIGRKLIDDDTGEIILGDTGVALPRTDAQVIADLRKRDLAEDAANAALAAAAERSKLGDGAT